MSWSYSGNPSSAPKDQVRFLVQDTDASDPLVQDEEIAYLIATWYPLYGSYYYVASKAAGILASKFAREVSYSADGVSIGSDQLQTKFEQLETSLMKTYTDTQRGGLPYGFGWTEGEEPDPTIKPTVAGKGFTDNHRAGPQEYGGFYGTVQPDWVE